MSDLSTINAEAAKVRRAVTKKAYWERERVAAILRMADAGATPRQIEKATGMTYPGVVKLLAREQAAPEPETRLDNP